MARMNATRATSDSPTVREIVRQRGLGPFVGDVARRFRAADGTSHTRALGYQSTFVLLSGFIGIVGLASVLDIASLRRTVEQISTWISPGPSSRLLQEAARQGASGGATATVVGLVAALAASTLAMAQVERSANRVFGSSVDRPGVRRYVVAFLLAISAGMLFITGMVVLAGGSSISQGAGLSGGVRTAWEVLRWPIGVVVAAIGIYLLYRFAPRERFATRSALSAGTFVAVVLWAAFTGGLAVYFAVSGTSNATYGPLLSIVALLLWSGLTSLALHLGLSVAAEVHANSPHRRVVEVPDVAEIPAVRHSTQ
jgi:YihY family inner membrane protein